MNVPRGQLLVGRAWRWTAEQIEKDIEIDRRQKIAEGAIDPEPSISVFAVRHDCEETDATMSRLVSSVKRFRNAKWLAVVTEEELVNSGYTLVLSEPPPDHHDLILGRLNLDKAILDLESIFNVRERVKLS